MRLLERRARLFAFSPHCHEWRSTFCFNPGTGPDQSPAWGKLAGRRGWQRSSALYGKSGPLPQIGDRWGTQQENDLTTALAHYHESLRLRLSIGDKHGIAESLERLATLAHCPEQAIQLLATAHALRQTIGAPVLPIGQESYDQHLNALRTQMSETTFIQAWNAGQALSYEQAASNALAVQFLMAG